MSSSLCNMEESMQAPNGAVGFRLNQCLQFSTKHADAGSGLCVGTACAGFLSIPDNRNTVQIHLNRHKSGSARLNALVPQGKKAAGLHPGSYSSAGCSKLTLAPDELIRHNCNILFCSRQSFHRAPLLSITYTSLPCLPCTRFSSPTLLRLSAAP